MDLTNAIVGEGDVVEDKGANDTQVATREVYEGVVDGERPNRV